MTNAPYTWFTLIVSSPRSDVIQQIALKGDGRITTRSKGSSSWNSWEELALKSNLKSCFACVRKNMVINSDGLTAGAYGCYTGSITVPNGYRTTGIHSISIGHPGVGGGLSLMTGIGRGLSGTLTIYVGYYTPRAIGGSNTDFELTLECIKDEYYTPIVTG